MRKFLQVAWVLVCLLLNGGVLAADEATEAALAAHAQCTIDYGPRSCTGFVLDPDLQVLSKPHRGATPVGNHKYRPPAWIAVVEPTPQPETLDWIKVQTLTRPDRAVLGWVRREQVLLATDFRRVIGCWP